MALAAAAIAWSAGADLLLSPALLFGWGPFPRLGIAGAGIGFVTAFALGSIVLGGYLLSPRSLVKPKLSGLPFSTRLLAEILRVGAPGAVNVTLTNVSVALMTGLAALLGSAALAGYGIAARVEYVLIPLVFGFGTALVTMVATNVGAGQRDRPRRSPGGARSSSWPSREPSAPSWLCCRRCGWARSRPTASTRGGVRVPAARGTGIWLL